ncbi:MAG: GDP-perosamine synthase [Syntrophomonadaceae bacterium]|nr:GDP-perosamine synthase [Bacillota bacterium]MBT9139055.1 GDP-perosamine synthase [Bacillota bacterium]
MAKLRRYAGAVYDNDEILSMISAILDGWWSGGKYTSEFEKKFADFLKVKHAMSCNSGSSANLLAISALELEKGSEVITPASTFPTTLNPIIQCGLIPVFVDVELSTYNINPYIIEQAISNKTRLIMIPHTLGNPCNLKVILEICSKYNLKLIEDACDALGSKYDGKFVSIFGDIGTFSFYPAHHMTTGEGGMVVTNNDELAEKVRGYRDWGRACNCDPCQEVARKDEGYLCPKRLNFKLEGDIPHDKRYAYNYIGYNLKMTEIQAAMGLAQLRKLEKFIGIRNENFKTLFQYLKGCKHFMLPKGEDRAEPCWFTFPLVIRDGAPFNRDQVTHHLEKTGIQTRPIFAGNIIRHPAYKNVDYKVIGDLSNTDKIMRAAFFVGVYPGLTKEDMEFIGGIINDIDNGRIRFSRQ